MFRRNKPQDGRNWQARADFDPDIRDAFPQIRGEAVAEENAG